MKYIKEYKDGDRIFDIYFCKFKSSAVTKNGKSYDNVILQDKTGTLDAKIWDPNNAGIADFDAMDYIEVYGDITSFNGALQANVKRVRRCEEGEYDEQEYMPVSSKNLDEMYAELLALIDSIENTYLKTLLQKFFVEDQAFAQRFRKASAAKTVHHGFIGGLLEHTLGVAKLCDFYCIQYPVLNRDLLMTAAICHDMGKTREISPFPANDYTNEGQFLGHIVMGSEMLGQRSEKFRTFRLFLQWNYSIVFWHIMGSMSLVPPKSQPLSRRLHCAMQTIPMRRWRPSRNCWNPQRRQDGLATTSSLNRIWQ